MAQAVEQGGGAKQATTPTAQTSTPKGITREAFQTRLKAIFSPPPSAAARPQTRQRGGMMKMAFGMIVFLLAAEFVGPVLAVINAKLHIGLDKIVVLPRGVPLLGGMTALLLLYFLAILGLWIALLKFNIIPRDPFGVKAAQRERNSAAAVAAARRPGSSPRSRAERRHATTTASTAKATTTAKGSSGVSAKAPTTTSRSATVRAVEPGDHDDAYERARAAAQKRRRAARR
jgi:hypothetical protein